MRGEGSQAPAAANHEHTFRKRFPAEHRTTDGHLVRSKAEMLIDNWLYMAEVVHAYERRLPIEEEVYCDFYFALGRVRTPPLAAGGEARSSAYQRDKRPFSMV